MYHRLSALALATALMTSASLAQSSDGAAPEGPVKYSFDASHSQIVFTYNHLGFSTTTGMFSGFDGTIMLDQGDPANSSVEVSFPVRSMLTGWEARFDHFMNPDFFDATDDSELVTFKSTKVELEGDDEAKITGDLTLNGITKPVVLDAKLNKIGMHPSANKPWVGFDAETMIKRSDFELGKFAPYVSDEVEIEISVEAMQAE